MIALLSLLSCNGGLEPTVLDAVPVDLEHPVPGLQCEAQVLFTEGGVPHVYARDRADLARAMGFVQARDRYFEMELASRLGLGTVSALLGADALETDLESRGSGTTFVADLLLANLTQDQLVLFDAYAEGVNAYILSVTAGTLPPPSELELAVGILGAEEPEDLMARWDRRSVAGAAATIVYNLGFETGDIGRARTEDILPGLYEGAALGELRQAGAVEDLWRPQDPVWPVVSAPGFTGDRSRVPARALSPSGVERGVLDRAWARAQRLEDRLGHDHSLDFGSNSWAVAGSATADGRSILAGDGHLGMDIPSIFYQIGLDTSVLGGGDTHQLGLVIPGLPFLAVGTNGQVAWSQTQLFGDITDWYREELELDAEGAPSATLFRGSWEPVVGVQETYVVADVPLLDSEGRTETWTRYTTFDGRWIYSIEGTPVGSDHAPAEGETVVMLNGDRVVPSDVDGDGVITALSFDYTGFDDANVFAAVDGFGHSANVQEFQEHSRGLMAYSQNLVASDSAGSVLYTSAQGTPCREYLEQDEAGRWAPGHDPSQVLDGTLHGGFTVPVDGVWVDEDHPQHCVVPFEVHPQAIDPEQGFLVTANNDPGGNSLDESVSNDAWYLGGPWLEGYRADTLEQALLAEAGSIDIESTAALQGDTQSRLGQQFSPVLTDALAAAKTDEGPLGALYQQDPEALAEVEERLLDWQDAGCPTPSGVETFYNTPGPQDAEHAVATMLHNAWMGRFVNEVFGDEGLPDVWEPTGGTGQTRALTKLVDGRGEENPLGLASWNAATGESAFFDVLGTEAVETSEEAALRAILDALDFLRAAPEEDSRGGFGTEDMSQWIWGFKHVARMESILAGFLGDDDTFGALTKPFSITTETLPLMPDLDRDDPRNDLVGFPRPGDTFSVDAANNGFGTTDFDYGSGPVFRMVIALGPQGVEGVNVIPGGQSGLTNSPYFADQAALWLANETLPLRFAPQDVVAGANERWLLRPVGSPCK